MRSMNIQIIPPEPLSETDNWEEWYGRWEKFRAISGLNKKSEELQVQHLLYTMGPKSESLVNRLQLDDTQLKSYDETSQALKLHFVGMVNKVYERIRFFSTHQGDDNVEAFISKLYQRAERCQFGLLKEDMMMHQILAGMADKRTSQEVQAHWISNDNVTLREVEERVKTRELVKEQQNKVSKCQEVNILSCKSERSRKCLHCGRFVYKDHRCRALHATCFKCLQKGHYKVVCSKQKQVSCLTKEDTKTRLIESENEASLYIGQVSASNEVSRLPIKSERRRKCMHCGRLVRRNHRCRALHSTCFKCFHRGHYKAVCSDRVTCRTEEKTELRTVELEEEVPLFVGQVRNKEEDVSPRSLKDNWRSKVSPRSLKDNWRSKEKSMDQVRKFQNFKHKSKVPELKVDDKVWIKSLKKYGSIVKELYQPRSFLIDVRGKEYRRNRTHLVKVEDGRKGTERKKEEEGGDVVKSTLGWKYWTGTTRPCENRRR